MPFFHWKCHFCTENAIFSPKKNFFEKKNSWVVAPISNGLDVGIQKMRFFFSAFSMKRLENPKSNLEKFFPKKRRFSLKLPFFHWKCHLFAENAIFPPKSAICSLKMPFFSPKSAIFHWKCCFFVEKFRFHPAFFWRFGRNIPVFRQLPTKKITDA